MSNEKKAYEKPTAEFLEIRVEKGFAVSGEDFGDNLGN